MIFGKYSAQPAAHSRCQGRNAAAYTDTNCLPQRTERAQRRGPGLFVEFVLSRNELAH